MKNYFIDKEFACKCGCGLMRVDPKLILILNSVREELNIPIIISSGTRCIAHNESYLVQGAKYSGHLVQADGWSKAIDIKVLWDVTRGRIYNALFFRGIKRFEVSNKHLHFDICNDSLHPIPLLQVIFFGD